MTEKEEAYCKARAAGMGPSAAYRASRDTSRMATATVNANAKKLDRKPEIKVWIEELRRESRESSTAGESSEELPGVSGLTPKREAFLQKYLETSNASEAYRQVYDVAPDTKLETIARNAHAILQDTKVATRLEELRAAAARRHEITLDTWLAEQKNIAFADIGAAIDWGETVITRNDKGEIVSELQSVQIKGAKDMPREVRAAIQSIEQTRDGGLKVRFHNKQPALEAIAKHLGWYEKDNRQKGEAEAEALKGVLPDKRDIARAVLDILRSAKIAPDEAPQPRQVR